MNYKKAFLVVLSVIGLLAVKAQETTRYIFINSAAGRHFKVARPQTFTREVFDDIITKIAAPENKKLRVGVSCG